MAEFGDMAYTRRLSSCSDTCMLKVCDASDIKDGRSPKKGKYKGGGGGGGVKGSIVVNDRLVCI